MSLDELYQELILDHFRHPRCQGCVHNPNATFSMNNPLCGDKIEVSVAVKDKTVSDVGFTGQGCSISQASASMMASLLKGKSVAEARELSESFKRVMKGEITPEDGPDLGDAMALSGVRKFAARIKCALLAWEALDRCIEKAANP